MNKVILGVLALLAITLGSGQGAEESQGKALASDRHYAGELANLNHHQPAIHRRAREAAKNSKNKNVKNKNGKKKNGAKKAGKKGKRPKRKGGKRKGKTNAKKQSKGKKSGKRGKKGKRNKKRKNGKKGKGRKKGKKGAAESGKKSNQERQADTATTAAANTDDCCTSDWIQAGKDILKYSSYMRIINRMLRKDKIAKAKKGKAMSFDKAVKAIEGATDDCRTCTGNTAEQKVATETCTTLSKCSTSVSKLCEDAELDIYQPGLKDLLDSCNEQAKEYEKEYRIALQTGLCSSIKNLPSVEKCRNINWKTAEPDYMKVFVKCTKPSTPGSFGDCRKNERMAAYLSYDCGKCPNSESLAVVTTASSGRRQKRLSQFSNLLNRNF